MLMSIEGDYLEDFYNNIFTVKGLLHPKDGSICVLRYLPTEEGDRIKDNLKYRKVDSLREIKEILLKKYPNYLKYDKVFNRVLCIVKHDEVFKFYKAREFLRELSKRELKDTELKALELIEILKSRANLSYDSFGLSGSCLLNLSNYNSDIDLIVYGKENSFKVYEALSQLFREAKELSPYTSDHWRDFYERRSIDTLMDLKPFIFHEGRKFQEGIFKGKEFFVRFIKNLEEIKEPYDSLSFHLMGYSKIKAKVIDDIESIFTPCCYEVSDVEILAGLNLKNIRKIVSYRGRFCQQAKVDERIIAQGKVEKVIQNGEESYYQLVLGESRSDFMVNEKL